MPARTSLRLAAVAFVAAMIAAMLVQAVAYWPGIMVWDAIRQYGQALSGRFDDWHPPAMEWLWRQFLPIARGPAPMLVLQLALYWGGYAVLAGVVWRRGRPGLAAVLAICALLPIPFALMGAVLKDSLMAGALLAATGLLVAGQPAAGRAAWVTRAPALLLLLFAATIRFNAFLAALPIAVALLPPPCRETRWRLTASVIASAVVLLAALPVANRLLHAEPSGVELSLIIYDLGGIGAHDHIDAFPPVGIAGPVAVNARCYSAEKWDSYAWWTDAPCPIGFANLGAAFARSGVSPYRVWIAAILAHPLAYAEHRLAHFNINSRFLVRGDIERPVFAQSDPNPWGEQVAPSRLRDAIDALALASARTPLGWPIWWLALAAGALLLAARLPSRGLILPLALSALLYGLGYLVLSVASEMRYHLWTMIAALLASVLAAADLADGARSSRHRLAAALAPVVLVTLIGAAWRIAR